MSKYFCELNFNKVFLNKQLLRVCYIACHTCLRANVVYVPTCLRASMVHVPTCQKHANFSFLRANVPVNVPTCHTACQCFNLACQRAKWRANFSTWHANVSKGVPTFRRSSYKMLSEISILYYYIKRFCILLDIIVIHIICICIVNKNFIILHFYTSCHIKEKCVEFFIFYYFFLFSSLVRN